MSYGINVSCPVALVKPQLKSSSPEGSGSKQPSPAAPQGQQGEGLGFQAADLGSAIYCV